VTGARAAAFALSAALALFGGCERPTRDESVLRAIRAESAQLVAKHPIRPPERSVQVPKNRLPRVIASLDPEMVTVHDWGVDIMVRPGFDGGWGYQVARDKRDLPMPAECYSDVAAGIFWHGPC